MHGKTFLTVSQKEKFSSLKLITLNFVLVLSLVSSEDFSQSCQHKSSHVIRVWWVALKVSCSFMLISLKTFLCSASRVHHARSASSHEHKKTSQTQAPTHLSIRTHPNDPSHPAPSFRKSFLGKNKRIIINCRIETKRKLFHNRSFFESGEGRRIKAEVGWNFSSFLFKLSWKSYLREREKKLIN